MKITVFLADGFEEIEAIGVIDVLRRAGYAVTTAAVGTADCMVTGAHGIPVQADMTEAQVDPSALDGMVLPGGMPGTLHLEESAVVQNVLRHCIAEEKLVAAICAAPSILGHQGYLQGKEAICYPGFEEALLGAKVQPEARVVKDGTILTGRGPGVAVDFALKIVETVSGREAAEKIGMEMQCPQP
jgi:4-methyl-5(b-hydroxyethyl)-thiazole monophosphate biosynthesis